MPLSRLLILVVSLLILLGLSIWLITAISGLYTQVAWMASPFLANILLFLIMGLLGLGIYAFFYYLKPFKIRTSKSKKRRSRPKVPVEKTAAAEVSLNAIRQQLDQIQDQVTKQALLERSEEIKTALSQGDLRIVVFGTGSAGKTSLVNSLMGRIVGQVSAPMGTTATGETYQLKLQGLSREIQITDTPGILEAGEIGSQRAEMARSLATEADLLLFVVDNDLRQSESQPLKILAEIGKRSLLVFNKTDLYTEPDQNQILNRLKQRVKDVIHPQDVIPVAAAPQVVTLPHGEQVQPDPEILPLIDRMVAVLRTEGEDLMADNILLQSQRLGEEARQLIENQRKKQAEKIINRYQWIGAGVVAATPLPGIDLLATAAVNTQMVIEIGKIYGCELNADRGRELAISLAKTLGSLGIVKGAIQLITTALHLHIGTLVVGKGIQGITTAYLTRIAGKSFIEYFRQDQDWGDGGITEVVQQQFQLIRKEAFVKQFVKDAIIRVIEPLKQQLSNDELEDELEAETEELEPLEIPLPSPPQPQLQENDWDTPNSLQKDW
jgi:small GTP-binding protein